MARVKKGTHGGARKGAGRKPTEAGLVRRNRVVVMLADSDFDCLRRLADEGQLPVGTVAHGILSRSLRRRP